MAERIEDVLAESLRRYKAAAWDEGYHAGVAFGQAHERFDPSRDPEWDEPSEPTNPYRRITKEADRG